MSQPLARFDDDALYLDTMVFHIFLRAKGSEAEPLFHSIRRGDIRAYTSVLTFDELAFRMLLALIRDRYEGSPLDRLRKNEHDMIAEFYPHVAPKLVQLQAFPNLTLLDVTAIDLSTMHQNILRYHLRPRDALHLAAMQKCGCLNIASEDGDFDHVPHVARYTLS